MKNLMNVKLIETQQQAEEEAKASGFASREEMQRIYACDFLGTYSVEDEVKEPKKPIKRIGKGLNILVMGGTPIRPCQVYVNEAKLYQDANGVLFMDEQDLL